jgi:phosphatidylserine decarboxylase
MIRECFSILLYASEFHLFERLLSKFNASNLSKISSLGRALVWRFKQNFRRFEEGMQIEVVEAGPKVWCSVFTCACGTVQAVISNQ